MVHIQRTRQPQAGGNACVFLRDRCVTSLHAASGDAGGGGGKGSGSAWRKILRSLVAFGKVIGGTYVNYNTIY